MKISAPVYITHSTYRPSPGTERRDSSFHSQSFSLDSLNFLREKGKKNTNLNFNSFTWLPGRLSCYSLFFRGYLSRWYWKGSVSIFRNIPCQTCEEWLFAMFVDKTLYHQDGHIFLAMIWGDDKIHTIKSGTKLVTFAQC